MFALVDGNNFYASCEQVFQPALRERPLVVLSNNDGCAIARCARAKALGIAMGQPAHQLKEYVQRFGLQMRSANFGLYGDMSARIRGQRLEGESGLGDAAEKRIAAFHDAVVRIATSKLHSISYLFMHRPL